MKLRQIVRDQKLINFDYKLKGFISEADDEKVDPKDAFAGMTKAKNPSKKYWYVKDGKYKAVVDPPKEGGWELADKKKAEKEKKDNKKRDRPGEIPDEDIKVNIDKEKRDNINQEMDSMGLKPNPYDENSFIRKDDNKKDDEGNPAPDEIFQIGPDGSIGPGMDIGDFKSPEGTPYAEYIDDLNDRLAGDEDKGKDPEKKYDWRGEKHEPEGENDRPSPAQINDLRMQMFDEEGRSSDWAGKDQSTPTSSPPSDAMARQTAIDLGFPTPKGATRGPSKITGEMAAPAPGNPGSMMNEVFSVEGCNVAEAFYERFGVAPTVEEMEGILQEQFGNSQLSEDNGGPNGSEYRKKLRIAAEASITKFDRLQNAQTNNPEFGEMIRPPSEFYGAADSIEAQAAMIRDTEVPPNKIYGPDGPIEEITDNPRTRAELEEAIAAAVKKGYFADAEPPFNIGTEKTPKIDEKAVEAAVKKMIEENDVKKFAELLALGGGGGANPSDTATFARSKDGNLMILFHSDKMSTNDQQANSTLAQEARRQEVYLRELMDSDPPKLSGEDALEAAGILDEFSEILKETNEENDSGIVAQTALNFKGEQKAAILKALKANPSRPPTIGSRPAQKVSAEEFLEHFSNPSNIPTKEQGKLFRDIKENLKKTGDDKLFNEDEIDSLDASFIGAERTKRVVGAIQNRLAALDKLETNTDPPIKVGQLIETKNIIDKLHLYAADDPSSLAYQSGMCATVIGGNVVNREVLRSIFGVESAEELIGKVKVGAVAAPEGDWADDDGLAGPAGVPNSLLQRSRDTFVKVDGQVQYFTVGEDGRINGTTSDLEDENIQTTGTGKNKKPVKVGVVTGQKSLFYAVNAHGEDCNFASQSARPKEGAGSVLQTAYTYGDCMKEGIEKYGKESVKEESLKYNLQVALYETKRNTLGYHLTKAEEDYSVDQFIREINEGSLN